MNLYFNHLREKTTWETDLKFRLEYDRHPGRKVWLGSFEDSISGLQIRARVKMKPILLKIDGERWLRVDPEELLAIEKKADGRGGVYVTISTTHAISPQRIIGIRLQNRGFHVLELEGPDGEPLVLSLDPVKLSLLEECLDAINLGDGFLITGPEEDE